MGIFIKSYTSHILETALSHISPTSVPNKLCLYSIALLYIRLNKDDKRSKFATCIPSDVKALGDEYLDDAKHLKDYINGIFDIIANDRGNINVTTNTVKILRVLNQKPFYYIYYDNDIPKLLMASTIAFKNTFKTDLLIDTKELE